MARPGYTKLSGSSERYRVNATGEVVSRRQYDNQKYVDAGWRNRADFERRYNNTTYTYMAAQAIVHTGLSRRQVEAPGSQFNRLALKARAAGWGKFRAGRSANGPMAKLLVFVGLRDPNATYAVGDTPPRKR